MQENISIWLDTPADWTRIPKNEEECEVALDAVRKRVFKSLHDLGEDRISDEHRLDWKTAYGYSGLGSSYERANEIERIYGRAAPVISSVKSGSAREFLRRLHKIVREAVEESGGHFE